MNRKSSLRRSIIGALLFLLLGLILRYGNQIIDALSSSDNRPTIDIDGTQWTIVREAEQCEERVAAAIARYKEAPVYRNERGVSRDRFLINESSDCWIELMVEGVTDISLVFRVTPDNLVIDQRGFSYWGPNVFPYPEGLVAGD